MGCLSSLISYGVARIVELGPVVSRHMPYQYAHSGGTVKCKHCECELEMWVIPIGAGLQVVCACECGASWVYDIYSLDSMSEAEEPVLLRGVAEAD